MNRGTLDKKVINALRYICAEGAVWRVDDTVVKEECSRPSIAGPHDPKENLHFLRSEIVPICMLPSQTGPLGGGAIA